MTEVSPTEQAKRRHVPVMMDEVLQHLEPQSGKIYVDATLGAGGHAREIGKRIEPDGELIVFDHDADMLAETRPLLAELAIPVAFVASNFSSLQAECDRLGKLPITGGVLADIGVSSMQLDQDERGFSFSKEAPLDMRMDRRADVTASDVVNDYREPDLVRIFSEYGEERFSKTIARDIVAHRKQQPLRTTTDLAELVSKVYGRLGKKTKAASKIHPATRVFQALRIEVNDELGHLQRFLDQLPASLAPGARVVVISFHSLEDRLVKRAFRRFARDEGVFELLTSKPVRPADNEVASNPRARSARLRAAVRI